MPNQYAAKRVAGYLRTSRIGGRRGDGFIAAEEQREGVVARAAQLGLTIPEDAWYHDQDGTGGNFQRPEWEKLLARIEARELDGVIVVRVDRFARDVAEGAPMIARIERAGGVFAAVDVPMDTSTPEGRYLLNQFLDNAEFQLNVLKASWKRAKKRAIDRGAHIGRTPLGFARVAKNAPAGAGALQLLDDWRAPLRALFAFAAAHPDVTTSAITNWANEHAKRPDAKHWGPTGVGHVLANRAYLGEVAYRPRAGAVEQFDPLVNQTAHEALIDEPTFLAAQRILVRPRQDTRRSTARRVSILQGLVRCAGCRHSMPPSMAGQGVNVYRCVGRFSSGRCEMRPSIVAERIEEWVLSEIRAQLAIQERFAAGADDDRIGEAEVVLNEERAKLAAIETNVDLIALEPESWRTALAASRARVEEAEGRLADASRAIPPAAAGKGQRTWDSFTREEFRDEILPAFIDCVMVRSGRGLDVDERAIILWRGEAPPNLPGKGRAAPAIEPWPWPQRPAR